LLQVEHPLKRVEGDFVPIGKQIARFYRLEIIGGAAAGSHKVVGQSSWGVAMLVEGCQAGCIGGSPSSRVPSRGVTMKHWFRQHVLLLADPLVQRWQGLWREPSLGERGERAAERYLRRKGYHIIARSQRMRLGEIDLIAVDGRTLVFVEVKTRRSHDMGHPVEAITPRKQQKLTKLALVYLKRHDLLETPARFDCVAVTWAKDTKRPDIEHFENAFESTGSGQMF
jgi:putative endonuclease